MDCDTCVYYVWDEDAEEYFCDADLDEDDVAQLYQRPNHSTGCRFWCSNNEYEVVRHQI